MWFSSCGTTECNQNQNRIAAYVGIRAVGTLEQKKAYQKITRNRQCNHRQGRAERAERKGSGRTKRGRAESKGRDDGRVRKRGETAGYGGERLGASANYLHAMETNLRKWPMAVVCRLERGWQRQRCFVEGKWGLDMNNEREVHK